MFGPFSKLSACSIAASEFLYFSIKVIFLLFSDIYIMNVAYTVQRRGQPRNQRNCPRTNKYMQSRNTKNIYCGGRKKNIKKEDIYTFYMEYYLENGEPPKTVYQLSKIYNFNETWWGIIKFYFCTFFKKYGEFKNFKLSFWYKFFYKFVLSIFSIYIQNKAIYLNK